jgi:hypothetical protein
MPEKMIRFGGDNLPEGKHTWYDEPQEGGGFKLRRAEPGDVVAVDKVGNASRPGKEIAAEFVARRMAEYFVPEADDVDEPEPTHEPEAVPDFEAEDDG